MNNFSIEVPIIIRSIQGGVVTEQRVIVSSPSQENLALSAALAKKTFDDEHILPQSQPIEKQRQVIRESLQQYGGNIVDFLP